jgi:uncharacterized membrane protein YtjA (UPF0391 family)
MLGWMLIFLFMAVLATLAEVTGTISDGSAMVASATFTLLFVISALTKVIRGQA